MKRTLLFSALLLLTFLGTQSCNEDITLTGNFEETAVVYGLIDKSDSVHMIKITRAFIGPGNSLNIAQIPDSNYFQNITATVTEKINGATGRSWTLLDTIVTNKETDGVFYAPEQKVYAFYTNSIDNSSNPTFLPLNDNATYELHIVINTGTDDAFEVFGSTEVVKEITTSTDSPNNQFKFAKNSNATGEYQNPSVVVSPGNSAVVNTSLRIHYKEYMGTDSVLQEVKWKLGELEVSVPGSAKTFPANGESFFQIIAAACADGNSNVTRRNLEGITVEVVGGSIDLYNYILVNQPSSSIAQNKPTFTNLTATNDHPVIGIFSSRYTYRVYHPMVHPSSQNIRVIDRTSTMELCIGPITGSYLFCSQQPLDILTNQSYACN